MRTFDDGVEEVKKLLEASVQCWLLGAGASYDAKIPLMYPLTDRVKDLIDAPRKPLYEAIASDLSPGSHIEHILSHLGDLIAIASRNASKTVSIGTLTPALADLRSLHGEIVGHISTIVRYGYRPSLGGMPAEIGTPAAPIVDVEHHKEFIEALFEGRANLESRSRVTFVTTNYDTLLEDALALSRRTVFDGFSGGGIGFWIGHSRETTGSLTPKNHQLIKLHGSVDWMRGDNGSLVRGRYGAKYLADLSRTLIYPQATKYVETQRDPFANQFEAFREALSNRSGHVLCTIGYSFGDEHINQEVESALFREGNKTTLIAFSKEVDDKDGAATMLPEPLDRWRKDVTIGSRIFVATNKALYVGSERHTPDPAVGLAWWSFLGMTKFLKTGEVV